MAHLRSVEHIATPYLLGLGLAVLAGITATVWQSDLLKELVGRLTARDEGSTLSIVYALQTQQWTQFDVNPPDGLVRLLVTATATEGQPAASRTLVDFGIEYELAGRGPPTSHHFRAPLNWLREAGSTEPVPAAQVVSPRPAVASTSQLLLLASGDADKIRLRRLESPGVQDVMVRVFTHERLPVAQAGRAWIRLDRRSRRELASALVYPADLLEPESQERLVLSRWLPVGPEGIEGRDYHSARLVLQRRRDRLRWHDDFVGFGLVAGPGKAAVFPVEPPSGTIEFVLEPHSVQPDLVARVTYQTPELAPASSEVVRIDGPLRRSWTRGWISIETDHPALVRAFDAATGEDLTPETRHTPVWAVGPGSDLQYELAHVAGEPTPLKIDLRTTGVGQPPISTGARLARWEWLDADDRIIHGETVSFQPRLSSTDVRDDQPLDGWVSEARSVVLLAPPAAQTLRISSDTTLWTTVYDRPLHLGQTTQVPDDYRPWQDNPDRQPLWFSIQPKWDTPPERLLIRRQPSAPERDSDLLAGTFSWRQWHPEDGAAGAWFLLARESSASVRPESQSNVFHTWPAREPATVQIAGRPDGGLPRVEVIYQQAAPDARLQVDDAPVPLPAPLPERGMSVLPPLPAGPHRLQLNDRAGGQWMINHLTTEHGGYLRIFAQRLRRGERLIYAVGPGAADRRLSVRAIVAEPARPVELNVTALDIDRSGARSLSDWSVADRTFQFTAEPSAPLMGYGFAAGTWFDAGAGLLPLGQDLSGSEVRLALTIQGTDTAYVSVYEISPGLTTQSQSRKDRAPDEPTP